MPDARRRALLLVLDGAGYSTEARGNAVTAEFLPRMFGCMEREGFAVLGAAGEAVGLEAGQVGNSEAGHLTIGAGRVIPSMARRILEARRDGSWAADPAWAAWSGGPLHLVGLVSDAGVHGLARTIVHAAEVARAAGVPEVHVHPVLDGVDSLAGSAPALLAGLRAELGRLDGVHLGVVQGRAGFCDRSGDLARTRRSAEALAGDVPLPPFDDERLAAHLAGGAGEATFPPALVPGGRAMRPGEPVLITSHRADRARQIAAVLAETRPVLALVDLGKGIPTRHVFFPQAPLDRGLAFELRGAGLASVRLAEKCKFPHVTFFLNGFDASAEGRGICVPSLPEAEIPAHPEMSLAGIEAELLRALSDPAERAIVANLANLDQVGHLGRLDLAARAAAEVDRAFESIASACRQHGWTLLVTADHGNADRLVGDDGRPFGSHTDRPVPFFVQPAPGLRAELLRREGTLANVAASVLGALGLPAPAWMEPALVRFTAA